MVFIYKLYPCVPPPTPPRSIKSFPCSKAVLTPLTYHSLRRDNLHPATRSPYLHNTHFTGYHTSYHKRLNADWTRSLQTNNITGTHETNALKPR